MIRTALALFPFIDDLKSDLLGTLQKIKKMGFDGVEFAYGFNYNPDDLRKALNTAELELVGWHMDKSYIDEEFFTVMVYYMRAAGNKRIIIPSLPDNCIESVEAWKQTATDFNLLSKKLMRYGILLGYHNEDIEFKRIQGGYLFDIFCQNTDSNVLIELDLGNMLSSGASPEEFLMKYPGRFETIHLKPFSLVTGFSTMIGKDSINYHKVINNCKNAGTKWLIIEYENTDLYDKYEGAKICLNNLRGFFNNEK